MLRAEEPTDQAGVDLSRVRVHTGSKAAEAAWSVGSRAFTVGHDLVFNAGEYQPQSPGGRRLLAHELSHVVQQTTSPHSELRLFRQIAVSPPDPVNAVPPTGVGPDTEGMHDVKTEAKKDDKADAAGAKKPDGDGTDSNDVGKSAKAGPPSKADTKVDAKSKISKIANQSPVGKDAAAPEKDDQQAAAEVKAEAQSVTDLGTGDLATIDAELAEHQRWGAATATVGAAGSGERAQFIAQSAAAGSGFGEALLKGAATGAGMKVAEKAVEKGALKLAARFAPQVTKFTPLPAVGAVIGGVMSAYDLASRDWKATGESIGRFGQGADVYETLANSIESISTILDVATAVLNVIAGIIGAISIAMWIITIITVGIASPLALTLSTIAGGIGLASLILDGINAVVLKQLITLFRALHTFTSDADPRDVVVQGDAIKKASGAATGFVGGFAGGVAGGAAAEKGIKMGAKAMAKPPSTPVPDHPMPSAAGGDGPGVKAQAPEGKAGTKEAGKAMPDQTAPTTATPETKSAPAEISTAPAPKAKPAAKAKALAEGTPATDAGKAKGGGPKPAVPEEGNIVWGATEQLGEKFEMGGGAAPGKRMRALKSASESKAKLQRSLVEAGADVKKQQAARTKFEQAMAEANADIKKEQTAYRELQKDMKEAGPTNSKKEQAARREFQKRLDKIHDKRVQATRNSWKEFWKSEGKQAPIDVEAAFKGWDAEFGDVMGLDPKGPGKPLTGPVEAPARVLPLKEPPHVTAPGQGEARSGLVGRHSHQPARGSALISEHIMPGAQFEAITPGYAEHQYPHDITMQFGKEEAGIKTHEGPTADNARTRALKGKIAKGERVDIVKDIYLPSIDETIRARDVAEQRRAARGPAEQPPPQQSTPASMAPAVSDAPQATPAAQSSPASPAPSQTPSQQSALPPGSAPLANPPVSLGEETRIRVATDETPRVRIATDEGRGSQAAARSEADRYAQAMQDEAMIEREREAESRARLQFFGLSQKPSGRDGQSGPQAIADPDSTDPTRTSYTVRGRLTVGEKAAYLGAGTALLGVGGTAAAAASMSGFEEARREPVVEHVNPHYPPPPCSPQDIIDVQNQILETLDAREKAEAASSAMSKQQAHHKANEKPLTDMQKGTDDALSATEAHKQAVARRTDANQKKKKNEDQAAGMLSDYSNRAAKLSTITVPMRGFERFTSLAYSMPDDPNVLPLAVQPFSGRIIRAKKAILKMNTDAKNFLKQLDTMDSTIKDQKATQSDRDKQVQTDAKTLTDTKQKAGESDQSLNQAKQTTQDLDNTNKDRLDQATKIRSEADQTSATLDRQAQQKQDTAQSMAAALQAWAPQHRQARLDALAQTRKNLEQQGYKILEVNER